MSKHKGWVSTILAVSGMSIGGVGAADMKMSDHWSLTGPVAWDYLTLDSSGSHLFVTRSTQVDILDTRNGKVIATIPNTSGAHGVALAEGLKRGYVSSGKSDSVVMFDLDSFRTLREAPVSGHNPDAILFDSRGQHVFTFNGGSSDVSIMAAGDLKLLATLKVPGKPEFAVADDRGSIFVNIETEPGQMAVIDADRLAVKMVWQLPGCDSPSGLAIDTVHQRLFSVCDDRVMVVTDAVSGKQVAKVAIGNGPDAVAYDAKRSLVLSSNGEGSLTVVHQDSPDKYTVVQTVATQKGARTMALDPSSGTVYLSSAAYASGPVPEHTRPQAVPDSFSVIKVAP